MLDRPKIDHIVCELFSLNRRPLPGPTFPGPLQRNHVTNVDIATVLNYFASERTDPSAYNKFAIAGTGLITLAKALGKTSWNFSIFSD